MTSSRLQAMAEEIARERIAPLAETVDRECRWPAEQLKALGEAGLMGLHVPRRLGGQEQGLTALVLITEALGKVCPSTSMCFGMHCVGTAVLSAKATPFQEDRFLRPIAAGKHVTTLTLSESGTGAHFYLPETQMERRPDGNFTVQGRKSFVTSGARADSYVLSCKMGGEEGGVGEFSCLVVEREAVGIAWGKAWEGFGMRGNSSLDMTLQQVRVPGEHLLGREGDQIWYVFEVVAPYFLMAMAGTYLGIAQACLDLSILHMRSRRHSHNGEALADSPLLQTDLAGMWIKIERARQLIYEAARLGDQGDARSFPAILAAKADVADSVVDVANLAMTLGGGRAYGENSRIARLLRDARASHVMAPTTHLLKHWLGRSILGLPIL